MHTTYPTGNGAGYWNGAMNANDDRAWSVLLALESEWGKIRAHGATRKMVLDDASKLTAVRATAKVLVSATSDYVGLRESIDKLRTRTRDTAPWLWINLPYEETTERCQYEVLRRQSTAVR